VLTGQIARTSPGRPGAVRESGDVRILIRAPACTPCCGGRDNMFVLRTRGWPREQHKTHGRPTARHQHQDLHNMLQALGDSCPCDAPGEKRA